MDALSASYRGATVAWYENADGAGASWTYHEIATSADGAISVFTLDVDGDGDAEALSASDNDDDTVAWYENADGAGGARAMSPMTSLMMSPMMSPIMMSLTVSQGRGRRAS